MTQRRRKLLTVLQLTRLDLIFPAVGDLWLMVLLAYVIEPAERRPEVLTHWGLPMTLLLTALVGAGLHVYAGITNDLLDIRHDRVFAPQRPLAAGQVGMRKAVALATLSLLLALLGAVLLGQLAMLLCLLAAAGLLFYNAAGKYLPAIGLLTLGLVKVTLMLLANPAAGFLWPIWLAVTHGLVFGAIAYHLAGKRPRLTGGQWTILCAVWLFFSLVLIAWMRSRELAPAPMHGRPWFWPILAGVAFALMVGWAVRRWLQPGMSRRSTGVELGRAATLWLLVYAAAWLLWTGAYGLMLLPVALLLAALLSLRATSTLEHLSQPTADYKVG